MFADTYLKVLVLIYIKAFYFIRNNTEFFSVPGCRRGRFFI
nr:MAG TPA: hypothetical protein [Caudoviricetes sp.]